jgi:hypothetical protein
MKKRFSEIKRFPAATKMVIANRALGNQFSLIPESLFWQYFPAVPIWQLYIVIMRPLSHSPSGPL